MTTGTTVQTSYGNLGEWKILARSVVSVSAPASTTENVLATIPIPANAIGPNGIVRLAFRVTVTSSTNAKNVRVRYSGAAGTILRADALGVSNLTVADFSLMLANKNATNSQAAWSYIAWGASSVGAAAAATVTTAVDSTQSSSLVISCQKASAGETVTLEGYLLEVAYGA